MENTHKNISGARGFSLIEVLVAATISVIIMTGMATAFSQMSSLQRRGVAAQRVQDDAMMILETIAREVRVSTVSGGDTLCAGGSATNELLTIEHPTNGSVVYRYQNGSVFRNDRLLNSSNVTFSAMKFCVAGSAAGDGRQTRITIPLTAQSVGQRAGEQTIFKIQTTMTTRDLTTELQ